MPFSSFMDHQQSLCSLLFKCFFFFLISFSSFAISATNFSFSPVSPNERNITIIPTARLATLFNHSSIQLTSNEMAGTGFNSGGRAYYTHPIQLWSPTTNLTTDFLTYFEFTIYLDRSNKSSGGFAFFIASENSSLALPLNSGGGWLGLFNATNDGNSSNQVVAVEFDTYQDQFDPSDNHVGIDVNSIVSIANRTWNNTMVSGDTLGASISYNGTSGVLNVFLKDPDVPGDYGALNLSYSNLHLRDYLPEKVFVGFSASSGDSIPTQNIRSWNFTSTLDADVEDEVGGGDSKMWILGLAIGLVVLIVSLVFGLLWRNSRRKKLEEEYEDDEEMVDMDMDMDDEFMLGIGPKRFTYKELVLATNNFSEEGKLGQGGFGGVYKGFLAELNVEIAVKKISSSSKQGKKEYVSEVKTISRLRHRNLVQLIGWSHKKGSFLLVYEYMPNASLDYHLFGKRSPFSWPVRYKIVQGLASGLLYLHEEWEQCVIHRDIKSSNVMLDSNFDAKLGDFGLARLVAHGVSSQTTVIAGTLGYMAPECYITSKASKESDVFSFGVVALEIACGRKAVEPQAEESKVSLVNWVWDQYGRGRLLEAVDEALNGEFDSSEIKCLMIVGLWCAHPDHNLRPSIRQAIQVLNFEASLPGLPTQMPVPMYYSPDGTVLNQFTHTWSTEATDQTFIPSMTSNQTTLSRVPSSNSLLYLKNKVYD